ncbi:MAG: TetR/AcrR family transcriptional regulator [Nevskia sp.]|nr:TetR/AcrR family transcriptional regulator [Nevskia sp.]
MSMQSTAPAPPAKALRTRLPPDQRRAQLLRCAIGAFAEHGVARATHSHVAERAGVSVSAVHSYFRAREDLVAATLDEVEAILMRIILDLPVEKLSVREALSMMAEGFDRAAREDSDVIKVWLDWSTGFRADVWPRYLRMQERLLAVVHRVLARGKRQGALSGQLNTKAAARLFVGGGHSVALSRLEGATEQEIRVLVGHLVESVAGIGRGGMSQAGRG